MTLALLMSGRRPQRWVPLLLPLLLQSALACDWLFEPRGGELPGEAKVLWKFPHDGAAGDIYADDSLVVFYPFSGTSVAAADPRTGLLRWRRTLAIPREVFSGTLPMRTPLAYKSIIVIPGWDLYGLDRGTGAVRWTLRNDDFSGFAATLADGAVYSAGIGRVYRVDALSGTMVWQTQVGEWSDSIVERPYAPVYADGVVYVGTAVLGIDYTIPLGRRIGRVVALDAGTGAIRWRFEIPEAYPFNGGAVGPGAVAGDVFIIGTDNARVYGLDRDSGVLRWVHQGSQPYEAGVVVLDEVAVTANLNGHVEGLDPSTGRLLWRTPFSSSVLDRIGLGEGVALVSRGRLQAYDAHGTERWGHGGAAWGGPVYLSAARFHRGRVYIGDHKALYALVPPRTPATQP